jgi:hypothetical protein
MPASTRRSAARLVATVLLVALAGGCAGQGGESTAAGQSATSTTVAPTTTTIAPMTAEELAWLKAVTRLRKKINKVFSATGEVYLTRAKMTQYMNTLRSCSRELARIGSPSDRLQPVYVLVKKACRSYDKGASCWAKAIAVSDVGGGVTEANLETFDRSIDCGHEAQGNGSNTLVDAEEKGKAISAKSG